MIWFTADCHFGHKNIIEPCSRPFGSVEEMDEVLLRNWRERVQEDDDVYIVGDLMYYCKNPTGYLAQLPGRKHLIVGNHDPVWMSKVEPESWMESIQNMAVIDYEGYRLTLCHYPMMIWEGFGRNGLLIYGHIHNDTHHAFWPLLKGYENAFNAGVEINDYRPVSLEELMENNRRFKAK